MYLCVLILRRARAITAPSYFEARQVPLFIPICVRILLSVSSYSSTWPQAQQAAAAAPRNRAAKSKNPNSTADMSLEKENILNRASSTCGGRWPTAIFFF